MSLAMLKVMLKAALKEKTMREITDKEILDFVKAHIAFGKDLQGILQIKEVNISVVGDVNGNIGGNVVGDIIGDVWGNVEGDVCGDVGGDVRGSVIWDVYGKVLGKVHGAVCGNVKGKDNV